MISLTPDLASRFAQLTVRNVVREFPNKLDHVISSPGDVRGPRELHPIFFGCFDWHSCVHGFWQLARLYRMVPDLPERAAIAAHFDTTLTDQNVEAELRYLHRPESLGFERPYGWAWLLMLAHELSQHDHDAGRRWHAALSPMARLLAQRFVDFLPKAHYPIRAGTHANTAFAVTLAREYAISHQDHALRALLESRARDWYGNDMDCQAWEPSLDEFLSPAMMEAECMRRVLGRDEFRSWFGRFLPRLAQGEPATLFQPATVTDRTDGKIAHLDGLNLSRAWCLRGIATTLDANDPLRHALESAATAHLEASLPHVSGNYAGEHWLATFAVLAMSEA